MPESGLIPKKNSSGSGQAEQLSLHYMNQDRYKNPFFQIQLVKYQKEINPFFLFCF